MAGFADPLIFLFFGGFALASAMSAQGLDRWIADSLLRAGKGSFLRVSSLIFCASAFLSMWMSNTATTALMIPLVIGILRHLPEGEGKARNAVYLLLGTAYASSIGGLGTIAETAIELHEKGPRRVSPFFIPSALINLVSGQVSIRYGFKGPNHAVVTACATGAHAIGDAARLIKYGDADVMLAGGAEASVVPVGIAGFIACRAMSTNFNDAPEKASRPYDKDRDGFVMGEGAGILVLEELEHAKARGAKIYAEVIGYGLAGDAYHITAPAEDGDGGFRAMKAAIKDAGIDPGDIDYINAHGTSTPLGDEIELGAVERLLGNAAAKATMSSTKSATGHLLGAAGAIEAAFSCLAIRDQVAPPTINLDNPSVETPIDLVANKAKPMEINVVLSNSFGFGGTNASVIFKKYA